MSASLWLITKVHVVSPSLRRTVSTSDDERPNRFAAVWSSSSVDTYQADPPPPGGGVFAVSPSTPPPAHRPPPPADTACTCSLHSRPRPPEDKATSPSAGNGWNSSTRTPSN